MPRRSGDDELRAVERGAVQQDEFVVWRVFWVGFADGECAEEIAALVDDAFVRREEEFGQVEEHEREWHQKHDEQHSGARGWECAGDLAPRDDVLSRSVRSTLGRRRE